MQTTPVYTFAKWQVKAGMLDKVLELIATMAEQSRKEEGNLLYTVNQSTSDANTLLLYEAYRDQEALEAHRGSDHYRSLIIETILPLLAAREIHVTSQLSL
jgi:(4S)-4-hydroxy-5-phosphonooxypentane-2,3-dione isomerase